MILILFFLSGLAGLVYEVVWARSLSLILGVTTYATATVLATFMGGLALGSYVFGRRADRIRRPVVTYVLLELGIGLYALCMPVLFEMLRPAYIAFRHEEMPQAAVVLVRALCAASLLLLPTMLMGGTLPVLARGVVRARDDAGREVGALYLANTVGAIVGCLLAGFVLIERLGLRGTTQLAAATNVAVALTAFAWLRHLGAADVTSRDTAPPTERDTRAIPPTVRLVVAAIGLSGFTALGYEVLWSRALLRYLFNSTYAFTTMLATFLGGIALGSALYVTVLRHARRPVLVFALLELLVGVGFIMSSVLFADLLRMSTAIVGDQILRSFGHSILTMFVRASLILLLPATFLGATVPLAIAICTERATMAGSAVGRVYGSNTLGAILGSLITTFLLIPTFGMHGSLRLLIDVNVLLAGALAVADVASRPGRVATAAATLATLAVLLVAVRGDFFFATFLQPGIRAVYYREGATDTVAVGEIAEGVRTIYYDDQRGTAGTFTFAGNWFLGHLPLLLHPGTPRRVLHICFGVGNSLSAVAAHETVERIDSVELSPHVLEAAAFFPTNRGVIADPRVRTIIDDGRNFLMATEETYDVIELEPPATFTSGVINLYTVEFYRDAFARLAEDGVMMQWVPVGKSPIEEERMLFRAFRDVFPHATAWVQLEGGPILLIGTKHQQRIDYQLLRSRLMQPRVRRDFEQIPIRDVDHLLSYFIFDEPAFEEFVQGVAPITDDRTILDFSMPRYIGSGFGFGTLRTEANARGETPVGVAIARARFYADHRRSVVPLLTNLGGEEPAEIAARILRQRYMASRSADPGGGGG